MNRNVEIKARIAENLESLLSRVAAIADHDPTEIFQDDTFFHCPNGRLKLRAFSGTEGKLIFYQRSASVGQSLLRRMSSPLQCWHPDATFDLMVMYHNNDCNSIARGVF